jgi:lipoprotein-releasing system permease protein
MKTNFRLLLDITKNNLLSRLKQTSVAALGVTFGIGTFIILMGFMTGLNGLLDGMILNRTPHIHIFNEIKPSDQQAIERAPEFRNAFNVIRSIKPKSSPTRIHNALPLMSDLKKDERVQGLTPQVSAQVFYMAGPIELNGILSGIQVIDEMQLFNFGDYIVEGVPEDLLKQENGILIGAGVAQKMSLTIGNRVQVTSAGGSIFPLKIVGIFQSGLAEVDDVQSYVNLKMAQQILGEGSNYISDINVKLWDLNKAPEMATAISQLYQVTAIDIKTANAQFDTGSAIRNLITYAVSVTLLLVAGFGIYNILNMFIYEKMNDIAILKATGFSGLDVKLIFIFQSLIIGLVGGLLGLLLGYAGSVWINHAPFETEALPTIDTYPVNFNPLFYGIAVIFALASTFLAGYLPARRAQRIDPVKIIRGQ